MTETIVIACAAALLLISAVFLFVFRSVSPAAAPQQELPAVTKKKIPCILCGAVLAKGEKLHSKEIVRAEDSLVHMYGCDYCHGTRGSNRKTCPVCKREMGKDEYLIGRMWKKKTGKKHLHIAGCTRCSGKI